jgi:predicted transcriptional regulator
MMYGMSHKTTIYLPEELKTAVEREARRRGLSEAEVIRQAIASAIQRPRPRAGIIDGKPIAARDEELLVGFGDS